MNCEWRQRIILYADDELDPPVRDHAATHLQSCRECSVAFVDQLRMKKLVRQSGLRFSAPPELRNSIRRSLHTGDHRRRSWQWSLAAVAALVIATIGFLLFQFKPADPIVAEILDHHVTTLASLNPVDVLSSDRYTVKPWFQGKLPFTFNLPDAANLSCTLIGGKSVYVQQSPGAELLYELRSHKISVFIFQNDQRRRETSITGKNYSFTVEKWVAGDLRFYMVTDAAKEDTALLVSMFQAVNSHVDQ
jgi:anti-sigma factor RsiW